MNGHIFGFTIFCCILNCFPVASNIEHFIVFWICDILIISICHFKLAVFHFAAEIAFDNKIVARIKNNAEVMKEIIIGIQAYKQRFLSVNSRHNASVSYWQCCLPSRNSVLIRLAFCHDISHERCVSAIAFICFPDTLFSLDMELLNGVTSMSTGT